MRHIPPQTRKNIETANSRAFIPIFIHMHSPYKLRPATDDIISQLKPEVFTRKIDEGDTECSICKEDVIEGIEIVILPQCEHMFHYDCAIKWLKLV